MTLKVISLNAESTSLPAELEAVAIQTKKVLPSNPFVGLRPYESEESLLFFGRQKQIVELLQQLHRTRFLAVVGSSGCGKSSLIRAGLIPKLKAGFLVQERDHWTLATMKPGESPLETLAKTVLELDLASGPTSPEQIAAFASDMRIVGAKAVLELLRTALRNASNLLLLVDQFEELFRYDRCQSEGTDQVESDQNGSNVSSADKQRQDLAKRELWRDEAGRFVSVILELARQTELPVYVVITMRSDFLGDCDAFYGLPETINRTLYLVPRLDRQQRQEAVENPIKLYGQSIAPRLLDLVVNDVGDESDQLPVLQHALMRTWEKWQQDHTDGELLDLPHYQAAGMISDALSKDADKALSELHPDDRIIAERMFQALVDTDAQGRNVRRPVNLNELALIANVTPERVLGVVDHFRREGRCFLNVSSDPGEDNPIIDISHEAFIRQWAELRDWVKAENYSKELYTRLAGSAQRCFEKTGGLLRDTELQLALDWWETRQPTEAWSRRYNHQFQAAAEFLKYSKEKRDLEEADREKRFLRELETERMRHQNQRLRRLMYALGVISCVALLGLVATIFSASKARAAFAKAQQESDLAHAANIKLEETTTKLQESLTAAQRAMAEADRQTKIATAQKKRADEQARIAQSKAAEALTAKRYAQQQADLAVAARDRATTAAQLADSRTLEIAKGKEELRIASEQNARALVAQKKDLVGKLGALYQEALALAGKSETIEQAVTTYQAIYDIYKEEEVRGGMLSTLLVLGRLFDGTLKEEDPDRALKYYQQTLPLFDVNQPAEQAKKASTLVKMGDLVYQPPGNQAAADRYEEAIQLGYNPAPDDETYLRLGDFYGSSRDTARLPKAVEYYERELAELDQALAPKRKSDDDSANERRAKTKFQTLIKLGTVYTRIGDENKAKHTYDQAMTFGTNALEMNATDVLVSVGSSLDRPDEKQRRDEYFRKAVANVAPEESKALAYSRVGNALYGYGEYQEAITYFKQAVPLYGSNDNRSLATTFRLMGYSYEKLELKDEAIENLNRAIEIYEKLRVPTAVSSLKHRIEQIEKRLKD